MSDVKEEIPDALLKYIILGAYRGMVPMPQFPVKVDHVEDIRDAEGIIQHFVIVTESGLRFRTCVEFEGGP